MALDLKTAWKVWGREGGEGEGETEGEILEIYQGNVVPLPPLGLDPGEESGVCAVHQHLLHAGHVAWWLAVEEERMEGIN